jgi:hypothetical protein
MGELVSLRPPEYGANGAFALSLRSGTMAAGLAAGSEVFQFRWTNVDRFCIVEEVSLWAGSIVAFAAGFCGFDLIAARAWTADGSGGSAATLTGNNAKLRTGEMATSLVGAARIASTAALTVGTKALDAHALGAVGGSVPAVAGSALISPMGHLLSPHSGRHPLVLAAEEGFAIRATVPATGTWTFGVNVRWTEARGYHL